MFFIVCDNSPAQKSLIGKLCSRPFFVTLAGSVMSHRSEDVGDDNSGACDAPDGPDDDELFFCIHEVCRAAISPRRCPVRIKSFTMVAKCAGKALGRPLVSRVERANPSPPAFCSQARQIHCNSSSESTRAR